MVMSQKRRFGFSLACALALPTFAGCVAYNLSSNVLPLKASPAHEARFQSLVLGIELSADKAPPYQLEKLVEHLRESRVFKSVEYVTQAPIADLVLTQFSFTGDDPHRACALGFEGQILTIATIGLVPQICQAEYQMGFALYAPKDKQKTKTFSFGYTTRSVVGWAALFYAPSSEWKFQPQKEQYPELLKAVFYREVEAIEGLLR